MPDSTFQFLPAPHAEAARFIRAKPAVTRRVFDQMLPELKARAFVISGIEQLETMQAIRDKLAAVPEGADWDRTKEIITDLLENDLGAGAEKRAELLLRTHVFQAYSALEHRILVEEQDIFPFWKYKTMGDDRVRDSHAALDGLILPANDPFWQDHFPPWDWGCRCQVIPMTREEVEGIRQAEADLPPERRTVIDDPARLQRLRNGHLDRQLPASDPRNAESSAVSGQQSAPPVGLKQLGESRTWDVQSDFQRGREGALKWNPGDLRLPVSEFRTRYDADLWAQFEAAMRREDYGEGLSVWDWLTGQNRTEDRAPYRVLQSEQEIRTVMQPVVDTVYPTLTGEERDAIYRYQGTMYLHVNPQLRAEALSPDFQAAVTRLDAAIAKSRTPDNLIVWRRTNLPSVEVSQVFLDRGYMSTSLSQEQTLHFGDELLEIRIPKGSAALWMGEMPRRDELELLLPRNSRLRILAIEQRGQKKLIRAELIQ